MRVLLKVMILCTLPACAITSHPTQLVEVGLPFNAELIKSSLVSNGPIRLQKVVAANWVADRAGLINLDDAKAKAAGLTAGDEEIQLYFYALDHPQYGRYLIDTGVENTMKNAPEKSPVGGMISRFIDLKKLRIHQSTGDWLRQNPAQIKGVFLTHMHMDHIMGVPDLNATIPIFVGPQEATYKRFLHLFVRGTTDDFLEGPRTLSELHFTSPEQPQVLDFFGDKSLFVIAVPGHTPGSLAFVINSDSGPQMIVGDSCHTRWGWEQGVTPGDFSQDQELNQRQLDFLRSLAQSMPGIRVHLGHQSTMAEGNLEKF